MIFDLKLAPMLLLGKLCMQSVIKLLERFYWICC